MAKTIKELLDQPSELPAELSEYTVGQRLKVIKPGLRETGRTGIIRYICQDGVSLLMDDGPPWRGWYQIGEFEEVA